MPLLGAELFNFMLYYCLDSDNASQRLRSNPFSMRLAYSKVDENSRHGELNK